MFYGSRVEELPHQAFDPLPHRILETTSQKAALPFAPTALANLAPHAPFCCNKHIPTVGLRTERGMDGTYSARGPTPNTKLEAGCFSP